jgi:hypothetical protein
MARYTIDPVTGERTKVSGTNYIPPCLAKAASRKKSQEPAPEPVADTQPEPTEVDHG